MKDSAAPVAAPASDRSRLADVDRLVALGPGGLDPLLEMLVDPSWSVRRAVVASLAALGELAAPRLCELLRTRRDSEARISAAVDALVACTGDVDACVLDLTRAESAAVVSDAAHVLGRRRAAGAMPTLIALTAHADDNVAVAAVEALGRVGGRAAVAALVAVVDGGDPFRCFPAIDVLGRSGDPRAVAPLVRLLDGAHFTVEAARALGRTGERAAVAPLAAVLLRPGDALVRVAALALAELRDRHAERYGATERVDEMLRDAVPPGVIRRLEHLLAGADASEQRAVCALLGVLGSDEAVSVLRRLIDGPAAVAEAAGLALRRLGSDGDGELARALRDGDSAQRGGLLPLVRGPGVAQAVTSCLTDPEADVRALACEALARTGSVAGVGALFDQLGDPNPRVAQAAQAAIQSLGSPETEALALAAARSRAPQIRRAAVRILSYFAYASALPVLLEALDDPDLRVRDSAIQGLPLLDDPSALARLRAVAGDPSPRTRAMAMRALGQCTAIEDVTSCLRRGIEDGDPWTRYYACQSLGKLHHEPAAGAITALLQDDAGQVRVAAIEALASLGGGLAIGSLRSAAEGDDPDIQRAALTGLGLARHAEALPTLLRATALADAATRLVAVSALAAFTTPEVVPALARAARDPDEIVREAAIVLLAAREGADSARALFGLFQPGADSRRVLSALSRPAPGRVAAILEGLATADDELAPHLASALARMRSKESDAALFGALSLPSSPARKATCATLAAIASPDAFAALRRIASDDPDPEVRRIGALLVA